MEGSAVDHAPSTKGRYHASSLGKKNRRTYVRKLRAVRNVAAGIEKPREGSRCWVIRGQPARGAEPLTERVQGTRTALYHFGTLDVSRASRALRTARCVVPSAASPRSSDSLLRSQLGLADWGSLALACPRLRYPQCVPSRRNPSFLGLPAPVTAQSCGLTARLRIAGPRLPGSIPDRSWHFASPFSSLLI